MPTDRVCSCRICRGTRERPCNRSDCDKKSMQRVERRRPGQPCRETGASVTRMGRPIVVLDSLRQGCLAAALLPCHTRCRQGEREARQFGQREPAPSFGGQKLGEEKRRDERPRRRIEPNSEDRLISLIAKQSIPNPPADVSRVESTTNNVTRGTRGTRGTRETAVGHGSNALRLHCESLLTDKAGR
jgi:hypothetical protein